MLLHTRCTKFIEKLFLNTVRKYQCFTQFCNLSLEYFLHVSLTCKNITHTQFSWLYLEEMTCTLYSGTYSKNYILEVIQQSDSVLQLSQRFLVSNNHMNICRIFPAYSQMTQVSSSRNQKPLILRVLQKKTEYIVQHVQSHRPSKYWYRKFESHLQHDILCKFLPLPIILCTIIIPTYKNSVKNPRKRLHGLKKSRI